MLFAQVDVAQPANIFTAIVAICSLAAGVLALIVRWMDMSRLKEKNAAQDIVIAQNKQEIETLRDQHTNCVETQQLTLDKLEKAESDNRHCMESHAETKKELRLVKDEHGKRLDKIQSELLDILRKRL